MKVGRSLPRGALSSLKSVHAATLFLGRIWFLLATTDQTEAVGTRGGAEGFKIHAERN